MDLDLNKRILLKQAELSGILENMSKILRTEKNASKNPDLKLLNKQYKAMIREIDQLVKERDRQNKRKGL